MTTALAIPADLSRQLTSFRKKLDNADTPEKAMQIEVAVAALESVMRKAGLGEIESIRPVRETFLDSRWTLGKILAKTPRSTAGRKRIKSNGLENTSQVEKYLPKGLDKSRAMEAQRIATLPANEKAKAYSDAKRDEILPTISLLLDVARPYWYKSNREQKHKQIRRVAKSVEAVIGPFPLIYADPPWKFEIYSELGGERSPERHYPTLTDDELAAFRVQGKTIRDLAHSDSALLLWCTSSNIPRALTLMKDWGFEFKSSAVWVKMKDKLQIGTGHIFRNAHELLLYGTRGRMPAPQLQPPSVLISPRTVHSAKPPEIRTMIENMYPDFDATTRLELFARSQSKHWTSIGYEAEETT